MKLEFYIANRMRINRVHKNSVSNRIIKIASSAVAISVIMIILAFSVGIGFQNEIKHKTSSFSGHISIAPFENNNSMISVSKFSFNDFKKVSYLNDKKIENFYPIISKAVIIKNENEFEGMVFKGLDMNYNWEKFSSFLISGKFPDLSGELKNELLIPIEIANRLSLKIGDKVSCYFENSKSNYPISRKLEITGVFQTGFPDFDKTYGIIDLRHIQKINSWENNQIGGLEVFLNDINEIDSFTSFLYEKLPSDIDVISVKEKFRSIYDWISLFDFNILIILILMVIIGILNMSTVLLVFILERSKMIGLLKSFGSNNYLIQKIFLINCFYIMMKGIIIGNSIALFILFMQSNFGFFKLDSETYYLSEIPVFFSFYYFFLINLGVIFTCMISLLIPSSLISKIYPSKVLRLT